MQTVQHSKVPEISRPETSDQASEASISTNALSLRSFPQAKNSIFPTPVPPHLPPLYQPTNHQNTIASEFFAGSIESIKEEHQIHHVLAGSWKVCLTCQNALLGAFDHCLGKNSEPILPTSVHHIDEVADAVPQHEVPYFDIVKDPTRSKDKTFVDAHEKVERDRWVLSQKKQATMRDEVGMLERSLPKGGVASNAYLSKVAKNTKIPNVPGNGVQNGALFSGAIYKRMLDTKDKEIQQLREKLFDTLRKERFEAENVQRLRVALNRSVYYYTFAEEWQQIESERLQHDVRHLKSDVSALIAFLINSEEEKRKLVAEISELQLNIKEGDVKVKEAEKAAEEMTIRLHDSFKEFLAMDETMARLRKEAQRGTDAVESRNEVLQKNLDKLSSDFEIAAKDVTISQNRIRELEFELEELIQQFNICGEVKKKSEEMNVKLSADLEITKNRLEATQENLEQTLLQRSKLEADLRLSQLKAEEKQKDLEATIGTLTAEASISVINRKELEMQLKTSRSENEKLTNTVNVLQKTKEQLETTVKSNSQKSEREVITRDNRIKELTDLRTEDAKVLKKIQEQKEQLMFQTTELKNSLDREVANLNVLTFEMAQVKRLAEEKSSVQEDQIDKLTSAKTNLTNDKRNLTEKLRVTRNELHLKEKEAETLSDNLDTARQNASEMQTRLEGEVQQLTAKHAELVTSFNGLDKKYKSSVTNNNELLKKYNDITEYQRRLELRLYTSQDESQSFKDQTAKLTKELAELTEVHISVKNHLESVLSKNDELSQNISTIRQETAEVIADKSAKIVKLSADLFEAQEENVKSTDIIQRLTVQVERLEKELSNTRGLLQGEKEHREMLESELYINRCQYQAERKHRIELEHVGVHLKDRGYQRELEAITEWHKRDKKLNTVTIGLHEEYKRLDMLSTLLPTSEQLGNAVYANTKEFRWLFENNPNLLASGVSFRRSKGKHHHHHHKSKSSRASTTSGSTTGLRPDSKQQNISLSDQVIEEEPE